MEEEFAITMSKLDLLTRIKDNKKRFAKSYKALLEAYAEKAKEYQDKYTEYVQKAKSQTLDEKDGQPCPPMIPEDRTKTYDLYIEMLSKHRDNFTEVSESLFRQLWLDQWSWMPRHLEMLSLYAGSSASVTNALEEYSATD